MFSNCQCLGGSVKFVFVVLTRDHDILTTHLLAYFLANY